MFHDGGSIEAAPEQIRHRELARRLGVMLWTRRWGLVQACIYLLLSTAFSLAGPILIKHAVDVDLPAGDYWILLRTIGLFMLSATLFLSFTYLLQVKLEIIGQGLIAELKNRMLRHLLTLSMSFYDRNPVGRLTARVEQDTGTLRRLFAETTVIILRDLIMFAATICVMAWFHLKLTMIVCSVFPLAVLATLFFVRRSSPMFIGVRRLTADIAAFLSEHIQSMGLLQCFNQQENVRRRMDALNEDKFRTEYRAEFLAMMFFMTIHLLMPVSTALILGFGGAWVMKQQVTVGIVVMFILYVEQLFEPVFHLSEHIDVIQRSFAGAQRIFDLIDTPPDVSDPAAPKKLEGLASSIEFKNVWFRYGEDAPWAVRDVSFTVEKGSRTALVGETGGGKTTIVSLLFKFYEPQKGSILINGTDIRGYSQADLRRLLGLVQQDIYLFPGSLMDNLKLMDARVPDEKVLAAGKALGVGEVTSAIPYDMQVFEHGSNLSVGEKQVFSMVRAMVLDPQVLVLDEATSSVDPHTERVIQEASQKLLGGRTSLVIAHRLMTVRGADRILVVSDGEIKERGTHQTLVKKNGIYSRLCKLQFGT